MRKRYRNRNIKFFLGDVRDLQSVRPALYGVDYVFNAAALKQIPSCELLLFPESSLAHLKRVNRVNGFHSFIKERLLAARGVATIYLNRYNALFSQVFSNRDTATDKIFELMTTRNGSFSDIASVKSQSLLIL